ncbi:hypothetical protein ABT256_16735 [Amycolatopsis japonica]
MPWRDCVDENDSVERGRRVDGLGLCPVHDRGCRSESFGDGTIGGDFA